MDDHDLIIRIDERVGTLIEKVDAVELVLHEQKQHINGLKAWRDKVTGAVILANIVAVPGWIILLQRIISGGG